MKTQINGGPLTDCWRSLQESIQFSSIFTSNKILDIYGIHHTRIKPGLNVQVYNDRLVHKPVKRFEWHKIHECWADELGRYYVITYNLERDTMHTIYLAEGRVVI